MKPTKITFEEICGILRLRVDMPGCVNGYTVIESVRKINGKSIDGLRRHAQKYAKQWNIPFCDKVK